MKLSVEAKLQGDMTAIFQGLEKNLEAAPKGINKIFLTIFGRKYAQEMYYQALMAAQARKDIADIFEGKGRFVDGKFVHYERNVEPSLIEMKKYEESENLALCTLAAIQDASLQNDDIDDTLVSKKFFNKWRAGAIYASSMDERALWGKILSEENRHHGSFSLKTLDILQNVDIDAANMFMKACGYVVSGKKIFFSLCADIGGNEEYTLGLTHEEALILENLGLIKNPVLDIVHPNSGQIRIKIDNYIICLNTASNIHPVFYTLTKSGIELYNVVKNVNDSDIENICKSILRSNLIKECSNVQYYDLNNITMIDEKNVRTKIVKL